LIAKIVCGLTKVFGLVRLDDQRLSHPTATPTGIVKRNPNKVNRMDSRLMKIAPSEM